MRYILTVFLLSVTFFNYTQIFDNFSDGDFVVNPVWTGESTSFEIDANNQLHLIAPAVTDTMYLVTSNALVDNMEWSFLVNLDFNPSSSNLARVYLMSSQNNLKQSLDGYFVQIGATSDEVSLYKQTGTTITEIIDGIDDFVDTDPATVRVQVTRTAAGEWSLQADNTGNFNFVSQGITTDLTHTFSSHLGVFCKYTSTRSDKFYFDDFIVQPMMLMDSVAPKITNINVVSNQVLWLSFTENVDLITGENTANYFLDNGIGSPNLAEVLSSDPQVVELTFGSSFQDGANYSLAVQNIEDDSSNIMEDSVLNFTYFEPYVGNYKDVVITELMPDPNPVVGLSDGEYIELFNSTTQTISLNNWTISDGSTTVMLAEHQFAPQSYLLCYEPGTGISYGAVSAIEGPIPSLNNAADVIILRDNNGLVIDSVAYTIGWYNSVQKALGGWSLELKNVSSPCHDASNWSASESALGGTPGFQNSIYSNVLNSENPVIIDSYIENNTSIHFFFNKNIEGGNVTINPVADLFLEIEGNELTVALSNFDAKTIYKILISSFKDCWGNEMDEFTYLFAIPDGLEKGDVIINEILFNPVTGGSDYVEIVNVSEKVLAINDLQIANIDNGLINIVNSLANQQKLFFPGDYLVLTEDSASVIQTFPNAKRGKFLEINLPSFNNDSGTVILLTENIEIVDAFSYSEELQFALIDDLNGKALERLSFLQPTQSSSNWYTASENEGWGTPGYLNSQTSNPSFGSEVQLSQPIFSPDNDGYQDVLEMTYQFLEPDNIMDVTVYNSFGQPIRELKDNFFPGQIGTIFWDGLKDNGSKANVGTYILGVTVFDLNGNVKRYQLVGVLAARL